MEKEILTLFEYTSEFFQTSIIDIQEYIFDILSIYHEDISQSDCFILIESLFIQQKKVFFNENKIKDDIKNNTKDEIEVKSITIRNDTFLVDSNNNVYFPKFSNDIPFGLLKQYSLNTISNYIEPQFFYDIQLHDDPKIKQWYIQYTMRLCKELSEKYPQRSSAWYQVRDNMMTASDISAALGQKCFKTKPEYIREKVLRNKEFKGNIFTQWGIKYEEVANMIYMAKKNCNVIEYGLVPHPSISFLGASPDGITEEGVMLEIKCPFKRELKENYIPSYYFNQIQLQLECCGLSQCDYLECKLSEYDNKQAFINDKNPICPCDYKTQSGGWKGVLIDYCDTYFYCPLKTNLTEKLEWIDQQRISIENKYGDRFDYFNYNVIWWNCYQIHLMTIRRDRKWFSQHFPTLQSVWKDICHYRQHGLPDSLQLKKKSPIKRKKKVKSVECILSDDDD